MIVMKELGLDLNLSTKKTRKREFLEEMERVAPWGALVQVVEPHHPRAKTGRPPFDIETMLRVHYLQQWFALSDPAMEEALHDMPVFRDFAKLSEGVTRLHEFRRADYEGNVTRQFALDLGFIPVVPPLKARVEPWEYDREMYKRRNEVERLFRRLKGYRHIFSRFQKLDVMFLGFISVVLIADGLRLC
jgi:transposase